MLFGRKAAPQRPVRKPQQRLSYRAVIQLPVRFAIAGQKGSAIGKLLDLSTGGMRFAGPQKLDPAAELLFAFRLPVDVLSVQPPDAKPQKTGFDEIRGKAKIVKTFSEDQYGLAFVGLDGHSQEEIRTFLHLLQLYRIKKERPDAR